MKTLAWFSCLIFKNVSSLISCKFKILLNQSEILEKESFNEYIKAFGIPVVTMSTFTRTNNS